MRGATARATVSSPKMGTLAGGTLSRHQSLFAPFNNRTAPPTHCVQGVSKQQDDMAALSAQESKRAADIAKYVEQIPAAVVTEMLERVLNYTGEEDQRKVRVGQRWGNNTSFPPASIQGLSHGCVGLGSSWFEKGALPESREQQCTRGLLLLRQAGSLTQRSQGQR